MIFKKIANNVFKEVEWKYNKTEFDWEEIPQEDLWEDGELNAKQVEQKVIDNVMFTGDWIVIRKVDNG